MLVLHKEKSLLLCLYLVHLTCIGTVLQMSIQLTDIALNLGLLVACLLLATPLTAMSMLPAAISIIVVMVISRISRIVCYTAALRLQQIFFESIDTTINCG